MNELTETEIGSIEAIPPRDFRRIRAMNGKDIDRVKQLEELALTCSQLPMVTEHMLHGGIYSRIIHLPQGSILTGALVKVPTMLIVNGHVEILIGDESATVMEGFTVFAASANRKQAFIAIEDTTIAMQFVDTRTTQPLDEEANIQELEAMFTDEAHMLFSRRPGAENVIIITGE